jgi:uncharacterized protein (DUF2236 family)
MEPSIPKDRPAWVSPVESEALLEQIAARAGNSRAGIFGPGSITWKINRESAVFLGAGRAALLQLAHPWVTAALQQHSSMLSDPIARFHNTFRIVYTMIFGTQAQALASARHLYTLHTRIEGDLRENVAAYARGSHYQANEIGALRWVYATLVESAVLAYECALSPLAPECREAYYAETRTLAALFGLRAEDLPENWPAFVAYNRTMAESDALGVSATARTMAHDVLSGAGSWLRPPRWYRALTAWWLPERFREEFQLGDESGDRATAERALLRIRQVYPRIPARVRFVGPFHEAQARLAGRHPGVLIGASNRFWIGRPRMPFGTSARDQRQ